MRRNRNPLLPIIVFFILLNALFLVGKNFLERSGFDQSVLIMIKLFICLIAALIYIFLFRKNLNRPALFTCMGLYLVYTFIEVSVLTKMLKQKKNA
jgi:Ca2+/Na+ antiporter